MYSNSVFRKSNRFFQAFHAIPEAIIASNEQLSASVLEIKAQLKELTDTISDNSTEIPEDIPLEDADQGCIEQAFVFMRTLNEIESLMTDSDFEVSDDGEPKNNEHLKRYQTTRLYSGCIDILDQKVEEEQLSSSEADTLKDEFNHLFEPIEADWSDRATRLADIHTFRATILHFFAEKCKTPDDINTGTSAGTSVGTTPLR